MSAWPTYGSKEFVTERDNESASPSSTVRVLNINLPQTLDQLAGIADTLVFKSWPMLPRSPSTRVVPLLSRDSKPVTLDQATFDFSASDINAIFSRISNPRVVFYDPAQKICDGTLCHSEMAGVHLYTDSYHMSPQGALWFKHDIEHLLTFR